MKIFLPIALVTLILTLNAFSAQNEAKAKRKISSDDLIEQIAPSDKKITDELNSIILSVKPSVLADGSPNYEQTAKTVKSAIDKIVKLADSNPQSDIAQLYKAAAEHIPLFKGFVYRLRKVVEVADVAYISAIWSLKQFKQTSNFRAPYFEALFDLLTMPNPEESILGQKGMFDSVSEFQNWMVNQIAPRFAKTIKSMKAIAYKSGNGLHPIGLIKADLLVGEIIAKKYEPSKNTHREWILTSGHLIGAVSSLENYMGFLYYLSAYDLEKLAEFTNILSQETFIAVDGAASRSEIFSKASKRVDLLSTKRVYELTSPVPGKNKVGLFGKNSLVKNQNERELYKSFGTIRPIAKQKVSDYDNYLLAAKSYFTEAAKDQYEFHKAMVASYGMSGEDKLVINPSSYKATLDITPYIDKDQVLEKSIEILEANGPVTLEDHFIKKSYTINTSVLFDINKVSDLRNFLPNKFSDSRKERSPEDPAGLNWFSNNVEKWKQNFSWNYSYNKATQWKDPSFGGLLPNIGSEKQGDELNLHLLNVSSQPEVPYMALWLSMFYGY